MRKEHSSRRSFVGRHDEQQFLKELFRDVDHGGTSMDHVFNDCGRHAACYRGQPGDCVCRAISIVTDHDYQIVYDALNELAAKEGISKKPMRSSARNGVYEATCHKFILSLGYQWVPTMFVGQGCKVHLRKHELPAGRLIVQLSVHMTAVVDGVIHDTNDPSRGGTRCVYGYYKLPPPSRFVVIEGGRP